MENAEHSLKFIERFAKAYYNKHSARAMAIARYLCVW